ncbi:MAG: hypothetical protein ACSHWW_05680 [Nonlabens sp.]|uniref:hypothetical protein n=1 Tax=Nonlabens sp. TaxID=1888209 RepID=UPI003EF30519
MTSFVGKWKLLVLVLCCGYLAFAKAELPPVTAHTIFSSTEIATFSINKNTTRAEIFDLFKELFMTHSVKAKLNGYKRHAGVIKLLDLTLTDGNGKVYPLKLEKADGIDDVCLTINAAQKSILEFAACVNAQKAVEPVAAGAINEVKSTLSESQKPDSYSSSQDISSVENTDVANSRIVAQQVNAARKSQTDTEIDAARLRVKQQQEERRLDVLKRKAKVEAQQEENRIKNEQLAKDRAAKREQQLQEVRDRQLAKRQELEDARIAKLEEEKRQIAIETARIEAQAQAERDQLAQLEKERMAAQERQEQRRLEEEEAKRAAQQLKEQEKEKEREIVRVRKRLEAERLEAVKVEKERVKSEKASLERLRMEQEIELEKLSQERIAAQASLDKQLAKERELEEEKRRKERELAEQELIDERERYRGENAAIYQRKELMRNANEDDYVPDEEKIIEQGFLIFNAEQCSFKVYMGRTIVYDAFGKKILIIEDELIDAPQIGKVVVNGVEGTYEFTSNLLIIKNSSGNLIDENGKVVGAGAIASPATEKLFKVTNTFSIAPDLSKEQVTAVFLRIDSANYDTEILELTYNKDQLISNLVFRIGEESYSYSDIQGITQITIQLNEELQIARVID